MTHTADDMHDDAPMTTTAGISAKAVAGLVREMRHLVSLNEPERGGPYGGFAAQRCMEALTKAADNLTTLAAEVEALRRERDTARTWAYAQRLKKFRSGCACHIEDDNGAERLVSQCEFHKTLIDPGERDSLAAELAQCREATTDSVLDAAGEYMAQQYGNTVLNHPSDRARIKASLDRARTALKGTSHEPDA